MDVHSHALYSGQGVGAGRDRDRDRSDLPPRLPETYEISKMASLLAFAACCAVWLPLSLQQIVPAALSNSEYCHVSQEDLRVLPASGFSRDPIDYYTSTKDVAGAPIPSVPSANCLFQSYSPLFDELMGDNLTVYRVGPVSSTFPSTTESPAYLAGATSSAQYPAISGIRYTYADFWNHSCVQILTKSYTPRLLRLHLPSSPGSAWQQARSPMSP